MAIIDRSITTTTQEFSRSGTATYVIPETITKNIGNTVTDISLSAWMRKKDIFFKVLGLKPNEYFFPFFDGVNVSGFVETCDYLFFDYGNSDGFQHSSIISGHYFYHGQNGHPHETIVGTQSGAKAKIVWHDQGALYIVDVVGKFLVDEIVYGEQSHAWIRVGAFPKLVGNAIGGTSNTITLSSDSPTYDASNPHPTFGHYADIRNRGYALNVTIVDGRGAGQQRRISSYNGTTKVATITGTWATTPDYTSRYCLGPILSGTDGSIAGIFHLQDNSFHAGEKVLRFTSDRNNGPNPASFSEQKYYAEGVTQTKTTLAISTRNLKVEQQDVTETFPSISAITNIDDDVRDPPPASVYSPPTTIQTVNLSQQSTTVIPPTIIQNNYYGRNLKVSLGNDITIQAACHPTVTSGVVYSSLSAARKWQINHDFAYPSGDGDDMYAFAEYYANGTYRLGFDIYCPHTNSWWGRQQSGLYGWPANWQEVQGYRGWGSYIMHDKWALHGGNYLYVDTRVDSSDPGNAKMIALARYRGQLHLCIFKLVTGYTPEYAVVADATGASYLPGYAYSPYVWDDKPLWYNPWQIWYGKISVSPEGSWQLLKSTHIANLGSASWSFV